MQLRLEEIATGFGAVLLVTDEEGVLRALEFDHCVKRLRTKLVERFPGHHLERREPVSENAARMKAYAAGDMRAFEDALLRPGGTDFQNAVWAALRRIPAGTTSTYGAIAVAVGKPRAARAVGAANHLNPIGIAIPCHRVIGSNGSLTGYAAGLETKRLLLEHELRWSGSLEATNAGFRNGKIEATLALPFA
jgi:O-6-methylguanine DNA methyltransferase